MLPEPALLRLLDQQRSLATILDQLRGRRPCRDRQRLALRRMGPIAGWMAGKSHQSVNRGEGEDFLQKLGTDAGDLDSVPSLSMEEG